MPFRKPEGGVRPIALGCTLQRLVVKCVGFLVREAMEELLAPCQLEHGVRHFVQGFGDDQFFVTLDFTNVFSSLQRDKMLKAVENVVPDLLPFVHSAYCSKSLLFGGTRPWSQQKGYSKGTL